MAASIADRNNETWLAHIRSDSSNQQEALSELRTALLGRLRGAFSNWDLVDEALLEDCVQDSLLRIMDKLSQFEGRSQFLTWATSIAIRVTMTELRRRRWKDVSLDAVIADSDFVPEKAIDSSASPEAQLQRKALLDKMHSLIETELTEKQRVALLAELKGMPQDEIARHIGSNRNAIYKLTHDARKRLRDALEAAGYEGFDVQTVFSG